MHQSHNQSSLKKPATDNNNVQGESAETVNSAQIDSVKDGNPTDVVAFAPIRNDWKVSQVQALYEMPMNDLLFKAQTIHRQHFDQNKVQTSTLMSIKTGACPEDCAYCPQSGHYNTGLSKEQLVAIEEVIKSAKNAKRSGATRFCMGAAWRSPRGKDFPAVLQMIKEVKQLGLETCVTLGMLNEQQSIELKQAGLDYYNHNLDTSAEYYDQIITTRTFQDRLDTLSKVRDAGINVCAGGILGMGESQQDRLGLLKELANLPEHPQSVPINQLIAVKGTPLEDAKQLDPFQFIRMIAVARIMMPKSYVRLSAGRENMSDEMQAMCFFAGANSIFYGEKLLTTENPDMNHDLDLFSRLGIEPEGGTPQTNPCPRTLAEQQAQIEQAQIDLANSDLTDSDALPASASENSPKSTPAAKLFYNAAS